MSPTDCVCDTLRVRPSLRRVSFWKTIGLVLTLRRQRARLVQLDDHLLRDIGLTRDAALREASRPPWDPPGHWRR